MGKKIEIGSGVTQETMPYYDPKEGEKIEIVFIDHSRPRETFMGAFCPQELNTLRFIAVEVGEDVLIEQLYIRRRRLAGV